MRGFVSRVVQAISLSPRPRRRSESVEFRHKQNQAPLCVCTDWLTRPPARGYTFVHISIPFRIPDRFAGRSGGRAPSSRHQTCDTDTVTGGCRPINGLRRRDSCCTGNPAQRGTAPSSAVPDVLATSSARCVGPRAAARRGPVRPERPSIFLDGASVSVLGPQGRGVRRRLRRCRRKRWRQPTGRWSCRP